MGLRTYTTQSSSELLSPVIKDPPSSPLSLPQALASATTAISPWLSSTKPRTLARELRHTSLTLSRLRHALTTAERSSLPLFDRAATIDATTSLIELADILTNLPPPSSVRPRIKLDWRLRDRHSSLFSSPAHSPSPPHHGATNPLFPITLSDTPFPAEDRKRLEIVANRLDTLLQVALWKSRFVFSTNSSNPFVPNRESPLVSSSSNLFHNNGSTSPRPKFGRRGRIYSSTDTALRRSDAQSFSSSISTGTFAPTKTPPWHFSLVESPITLLRSRSFATVPDGAYVMAMWRGTRVSVKVMRGSHSRFIREADYLYTLGMCPNVPSLLGAHWEQPPSHKKKYHRESDSRMGYIVLEVANGVSLDKLVRQSKISDIVTKLRLLERVVSALVYAQKLNRLFSHQDLHPGNILLVPSRRDMSSPVPQPNSGASSAATFTVRQHSSLMEHPLLARSSTNSTLGTSTDASMPKQNSQSSFVDSIIIAEPPCPFHSPNPINRVENAPRHHFHNHANMSRCQNVSSARKKSDVIQQSFPYESDTVSEMKQMVRGGESSFSPKGHLHSLSSAVKVPPRCSTPVLSGVSNVHSAPPTPGTALTSYQCLPSTSASSVVRDDNDSDSRLSTVDSRPLTEFVVKVMDFPPVDEAEGVRHSATWEANEALSGYCPPEKVTLLMRRRLGAYLVKERERQKRLVDAKIVHGVDEALFMGTNDLRNGHAAQNRIPNGRHRHRHEVLSNSGTMRSRSGNIQRTPGSKRRQTPDSETYALFGDDDLVDMRLGESDNFEIKSHSLVDMEMNGVELPDETLSGEEEIFDEGDSARTWEGYSQFCDEDYDSDQTGDRSIFEAHSKSGRRPHGDSVDAKSKIDVWSVGWLLYYMCTEQHPVQDAWARHCSITEQELLNLPLECRDIVKMCLKHEPSNRPCLEDVKYAIDSRLQALTFIKGVHLLGSDRRSAFAVLDKAVGIQSIGGQGTWDESMVWNNSEIGDASPEVAIGLTESIRAALTALPVVVVRRVEWEAAALHLRLSKEEIQKLRSALVKYKWGRSDISDGKVAVQYLEPFCREGVSSAQSALGWIYRWGSSGVSKDVGRAMNLWEDAVNSGKDAEACNGLGLLYHHGRNEIRVDGKRAQKYYEIAVAQGYPAATVNLGVLLHDGADGVEVNGKEARKFYEIACEDGDGTAANNLGLLLHHGAGEVDADGNQARAAFEMAILRNERHHACRNLGELLWNGAKGVEKDRHLAVDYFAMAMSHGDSSSRALAFSRLQCLVGEAREDLNEGGKQDDEDISELKDMFRRCDELLDQANALDPARCKV